jgi:hypothetical protein
MTEELAREMRPQVSELSNKPCPGDLAQGGAPIKEKKP